jgi:hypothetical protein
MYPENGEPLAAVCPAHFARSTDAAIHIRINRAAVAGTNASGVPPNLDHLTRKLMSQNAGIGVGGMPAGQSVEIAAAHADSADPDERLTVWNLGGRDLAFDQLAGCV